MRSLNFKRYNNDDTDMWVDDLVIDRYSFVRSNDI